MYKMTQSKISASNKMKSKLLWSTLQKAERTYLTLMGHFQKNWFEKKQKSKQNKTKKPEISISRHSHEGQAQTVTFGSPPTLQKFLSHSN